MRPAHSAPCLRTPACSVWLACITRAADALPLARLRVEAQYALGIVRLPRAIDLEACAVHAVDTPESVPLQCIDIPVVDSKVRIEETQASASTPISLR